MGRSNRAHEPGGIYHVSTRGNNRAPIYFDEGDRTAFRHLLGRAAERHEWAIFAECLMTKPLPLRRPDRRAPARRWHVRAQRRLRVRSIRPTGGRITSSASV